MILAIYTMLTLCICMVGLWCGKRMSQMGVVWWVDMMVKLPAASAMLTLAEIIQGAYIAFLSDIFTALSLLAIYMVLASRFSGTPWLDLRKDGAPV
jgi:hypothetical protein